MTRVDMEQIGIPDWIGLGLAGKSIPARFRHIIVRKNFDDIQRLELEANKREKADPETIGRLVDRIDRRVRQVRQGLVRSSDPTADGDAPEAVEVRK